MKLPLALLACAAAFAVPAQAAPPGSSAEVADQMQAFGAWAERLSKAMAPMNEATVRLGNKMEQVQPAGADDPSAMKEQVSALRAGVAEVRQAVQLTQAQLAQIPPYDRSVPGMAQADASRLLTDCRAQAERILAYVNDVDSLAAALLAGDSDAVQIAARKVIRGGFLLLDSQVILYRGRQALFPATRSSHQLLTVNVQLYRTMSVAAGAWYQARVEGQPEEAARKQRTQFISLAAELEAALRQGRANLAREAAGVAAERPRAGRDPDALRIVAAADRIVAVEQRYFALGDDLLGWIRSHSETPPATLEGQARPQFVTELSRIEQRLLVIANEAAAVLSQGGG
jgi:hypothetical protein